MISPEEQRFILAHAYVPEHVVGMMAPISGGEPSLVDDYLCFAGEDWVILVGYPLAGASHPTALQDVLRRVTKTFAPQRLWCIAPEIPPGLARRCRRRESDVYYTLDLRSFAPPPRLWRTVQGAARHLRVERTKGMEESHHHAIAEFLQRTRPEPRIERLFLSMPAYTTVAATASVLTARQEDGSVAALFVVELAAERFATYVVGCHSKKHYVPGASDLLLVEMVHLAREQRKEYLHLGLGVNEGIRRFKEKWGGAPGLRYEFCELGPPGPPILSALLARAWP
jgi:hypothetical protein